MTTLTEWLNGANKNPWQYEQVRLIARALSDNDQRPPDEQLKDPGGVCFRLSFKWLACHIYGLPFNMDVTTANGASAIKKQFTYLEKVAPYEDVRNTFRGDAYYTYRTNVDRISVDLLNDWGQKAGKYNLHFRSQRKGSLAGAPEFRADAAMVIGIYGTSGQNRRPWAHATAFYRQGGTILYFDSNGGEFTLVAGGRWRGVDREGRGAVTGLAPYQIKDYALYHAT